MKTLRTPEKFRRWWNTLLPARAVLAANAGPLEKELVGEKFSLYSWTGNVGDSPVRLIEELRPFTIRPEGVDLIQVNGQWRVLFTEDRFKATGYGTRNGIHWPVSILGSVQ